MCCCMQLTEVKVELKKAEATLNMVGDPTDPKNRPKDEEEVRR